MALAANVAVAVVALLHVAFMVLEMFLWNKPFGRRVFGLTPELAQGSAALAANQGLYNGFLAAGLIWSLSSSAAAFSLQVFFLSCVIIAGIFGAVEAGQLSSVSVDNTGIVIGAFSNGIKKDIGAVQISLFQNTAGLESIGNGYYTSSANSGVPVATQAMSGGAGSVHGGSLEKSNSDVATQFVSMIQAQNGFQANARTIRVANDILRELSSLIR